MTDMVNHPPHYKNPDMIHSECGKPIECIDLVRHRTFNSGNAGKYWYRAGLKGDSQIEDLNKAIWYLKDEIRRLGGEVADEITYKHPTSAPKVHSGPNCGCRNSATVLSAGTVHVEDYDENCGPGCPMWERPAAVLDRDGDYWKRQPNGEYAIWLTSDGTIGTGTCSLDMLESTFSPIIRNPSSVPWD